MAGKQNTNDHQMNWRKKCVDKIIAVIVVFSKLVIFSLTTYVV